MAALQTKDSHTTTQKNDPKERENRLYKRFLHHLLPSVKRSNSSNIITLLGQLLHSFQGFCCVTWYNHNCQYQAQECSTRRCGKDALVQTWPRCKKCCAYSSTHLANCGCDTSSSARHVVGEDGG